MLSFTCYGHGLDNTPDLNLADDGSAPADVRLMVDEARITCTSGMLLCLDRGQRLVYILGKIFGVSDATGSELLEISRENFRQRLARARRDLHNFMNDKCGLVNPENPCRCAVASASVRVWAVMSRERGPRGGRPLPEGVDVDYPLSSRTSGSRVGHLPSA